MPKYLRGLLLALAVATAGGIAQSYPAPPGGPHAAGPGYGYPQSRPSPSPSQILKQQVAKLRGFLSGQASQNPAELRAFLMREVAPVFDFEQMSRWILGSTYSQLSPTQRQQFQTRLMSIFFAALGRLAAPHAGQPPRVEILQPRPQGQGEVVVNARVTPSEGYPVRVVFRFLEGPEGWRIYDVASNGSSAVIYYRNYFQSELRRGGPLALQGL
jgi:phospholipid transport system substrate-binding protein